jgi:hypothetical protein
MPEQDQKLIRARIKKKRYQSLLKPFPIQLKKVKEKGRSVIAVNDINAGTLIMEEDPVSFALFKDAMDSVCFSCLHPINASSFPCLKCRKQTFYCSSICQSKDGIHLLECEVITHLPGIAGAHSVDYSLLRLIVRFIAARTFVKKSLESKDRSDVTEQYDHFECVRDMVGHKLSAAEAWMSSISNAGNKSANV